MTDLARLHHTLGSPELSWLVRRIRERLERGECVEQGCVGLRNPSPAEREAIARLFGASESRGSTLNVSLSKLTDLLRSAELCGGLAEAIEALSGPVVNLKSLKQSRQQQWATLYEQAESRAASRPAVLQWIGELKASGLLRRLSAQDLGRANQLLDQAFRLVDRLPAKGTPLAELAADVAGDSHALDAGRPLGTIGLRAVSALAGINGCDGADDRRDVWAGVGVLCDELSAPVLTLNLRAAGETATAGALRFHAQAGEPYRLSTRQLVRQPIQFSREVTGDRVFVCENPTVVSAAANRLGPDCAPLVCIEGQPKSASRLLLARLSSAGIDLLYHGDFDWDGIRIGNLVMKRHGARPWRFSADAYSQAKGGIKLRGKPVSADWDPCLTAAMKQMGKAVHEEQVLDGLLEDLCMSHDEA